VLLIVDLVPDPLDLVPDPHTPYRLWRSDGLAALDRVRLGHKWKPTAYPDEKLDPSRTSTCYRGGQVVFLGGNKWK
jgi:hypothetical protein